MPTAVSLLDLDMAAACDPTFVIHELALIVRLPQSRKDRLIGHVVMFANERFQVLGSLLSVVCDEFVLLSA